MVKKSLYFLLLLIVLNFFSCLTIIENKKNITIDLPKKEDNIASEENIHFKELIGQYVYYHDTRKDMGNRLTGFLYIGNNKFIARTYEINTKKEVKIYIEIQLVNDKYEINILQNDFALDKNELQALNFDFKNILNLSLNVDRKKLSNEDVEIEFSKDENNIQLFKYSFWPPFSGLNSIRQKNGKNPFYSIIKSGIIKSKDDPEFFNYIEIEKGFDGFDFKIPKNKPFQVNLSGLNVNLDENWLIKESQEENNFKKNTYWISRNKIRYSQITSQIIDISSYKTSSIQDFIKLTLSDCNIFSETINVSTINNRIVCKYEALDDFYKVKNTVYLIFIQINDKEYIIFNINLFLKVYQINKDYFDKIINEIIKSPLYDI